MIAATKLASWCKCDRDLFLWIARGWAPRLACVVPQDDQHLHGVPATTLVEAKHPAFCYWDHKERKKLGSFQEFVRHDMVRRAREAGAKYMGVRWSAPLSTEQLDAGALPLLVARPPQGRGQKSQNVNREHGACKEGEVNKRVSVTPVVSCFR